MSVREIESTVSDLKKTDFQKMNEDKQQAVVLQLYALRLLRYPSKISESHGGIKTIQYVVAKAVLDHNSLFGLNE